MKARLFIPLSLIVVVTVLVPNGARSAAAQSQAGFIAAIKLALRKPVYASSIESGNLPFSTSNRSTTAYRSSSLLDITWNIETIESTGNTGANTSLALDADDNPHISYRDVTNAKLKYAHWDGSQWIIETVDDMVGWTSLELDTSGHPHISYSAVEGLRYAFWNGNQWIIQLVDSAAGNTSLALDKFDRPHISYNAGSLTKYAYFDGSQWHTDIVDTVDGFVTSIAVDWAGHPHIAYNGPNNASIRYAYWDGSQWYVQTVDSGWSGGGDGGQPSLQLDVIGHPHVSYYAWSPYIDLRYAFWDGQSWRIETIDSAFVGWCSSLALGSGQNPHIRVSSQ